jgi:hypothetical protein
MRWSRAYAGDYLAVTTTKGGDASEQGTKRPRWCATTTRASTPSEPLNSYEERNS